MSSPAARRLTQVEVPVEQRWSTRVVLQPIAAPSVLGLAGLSVSLMMAGTLQAKWWGTQADLLPVSIFGFAFGGIAQLAAAMWAYRARDVAATLTHAPGAATGSRSSCSSSGTRPERASGTGSGWSGSRS